MKSQKTFQQRQNRRFRIRKKIKGTSQRPRLYVYKSTRFLYLQLFDDDQKKTLLAVDSRKEKAKNKLAAVSVAKRLAEKAIEKNIKQVVFDRGIYQYHGVIETISKTVRENGIQH